MKVLLLDQFSDLGGGQQQVLGALPEMRRRGWQVVVGVPGEGKVFEQVRETGFECLPIACGPYNSQRKSSGDLLRFLTGTPRLAGQIRKMAEGASLVYLNGPRLLPAAALAGLRQPVLFHAHSYLYPGAVRTLAGLSLRRMDAWVVGVCRFTADPWLPFVRPERVSVIYNGVAGPDRMAPRRAGEPPRVGCIGRIAPEKGQLEFLKVVSLVARRLPETRFTIYGDVLFGDAGAQRYAEKVRAAAAGLPVEFAGWVPDVQQALASLDLLLVPSDGQEATTRVILEAFAAGVPVVALRSGGIPEVVDPGTTGYLADTVEGLAESTIEFLTRRPDLSQAARDTWERRFRVDRHARELADLVERIGGQGGASRTGQMR
jgi:glycosyltransferase involved in cell wall biosynthesis